jgi:hypothetical protein
MSSDHAPRPGGGTYPVRPAVNASHAPDEPEDHPRAMRLLPTYAAGRKSPRGLIALLLITILLIAGVLLAFSVKGYLPHKDRFSDPGSEAPAAGDAR